MAASKAGAFSFCRIAPSISLRLKPTAPEFQLAGDSERVALTCADLGVRADELDLPVPLDKFAYRRAFSELQKRGIIDENGRLTSYGKAVEALPVDRAWAELIVNADNDLVPLFGGDEFD